jgi:hypothetical protein
MRMGVSLLKIHMEIVHPFVTDIIAVSGYLEDLEKRDILSIRRFLQSAALMSKSAAQFIETILF